MDNNNQAKGWVIAGIVIVMIIVVALIWKASRTAPEPQIQTGSEINGGVSSMVLPYGSVTLGLNQPGAFQGVTIIPTRIVEDSRCPSSVQCIQAGTVRVEVKSNVSTGASFTNTIRLGDDAISVGGYSIALTAVNPYPQTPGSIATSAYRFTFDIHQSIEDGEDLEAKG